MRHLSVTEAPSLQPAALDLSVAPASPVIPDDLKEAHQALSLVLAGGTSRCETPPEAGAAPLPLDQALVRLSEGEEVWLRIAYPEGPCRRRTLILNSIQDAERLLAS